MSTVTATRCVAVKGIKLKEAADRLNTTEYKLREHLKSINAIRKTEFGYEATHEYYSCGLLGTGETQSTISPRDHRSFNKHRTHVLVTPSGISWLRDELNQP